MSLAAELTSQGKRARPHLRPYYPVTSNRFYYGAMDSFNCFVYCAAMRALHPDMLPDMQVTYYSISVDEGLVWC